MRIGFRVMAGMAVAAVMAVAAPQVAGAAPMAWSCEAGHVCFYTAAEGGGSRCMWDVADPNWSAGGTVCSWARDRPVRSVFNRGTSSATGVAFYRSPDYVDMAGCIPQRKYVNLATPQWVSSHKWVSHRC